MTRTDLIDAAYALRKHIEVHGASVSNEQFWRWDRAYWLATRALLRMGDGSHISRTTIDYHIEQATYMLERYCP